jgi:hypothetical protein
MVLGRSLFFKKLYFMKKRIILSFICFLSLLSLNAQFKKGTVIVGGNLNFSNTQNNYIYPGAGNYQLSRSQFQVEAAKAIKENLLVGVRLGYGNTPGNSFDKLTGSFNFSHRNNPFYSAGIYARKYVPVGKRFMFFGEVSLNYETGKYKSLERDYANLQYTTNFKLRDVSIGGSLGIAYKVSNRVNLELAFNNLLAARVSNVSGTYQYASGGSISNVSNTFGYITPISQSINRNISLSVKIRLGK